MYVSECGLILYLQAQNSFDVLSIDNLLFQCLGDDVQVDIPATLKRKSILEDLVDIFPHPALADELEPFFEEDVAPDGPPPRRVYCVVSTSSCARETVFFIG